MSRFFAGEGFAAALFFAPLLRISGCLVFVGSSVDWDTEVCLEVRGTFGILKGDLPVRSGFRLFLVSDEADDFPVLGVDLEDAFSALFFASSALSR